MPATQMPSGPTVIRFCITLPAALGAPLRTRYHRPADVEQLTLRLLRSAGVRMLVIDELHNILGGRGNRRREFLNLLRFPGNELRIPLIGVGTRDACLAIRAGLLTQARPGGTIVVHATGSAATSAKSSTSSTTRARKRPGSAHSPTRCRSTPPAKA